MSKEFKQFIAKKNPEKNFRAVASISNPNWEAMVEHLHKEKYLGKIKSYRFLSGDQLEINLTESKLPFQRYATQGLFESFKEAKVEEVENGLEDFGEEEEQPKADKTNIPKAGKNDDQPTKLNKELSGSNSDPAKFTKNDKKVEDLSNLEETENMNEMAVDSFDINSEIVQRIMRMAKKDNQTIGPRIAKWIAVNFEPKEQPQ